MTLETKELMLTSRCPAGGQWEGQAGGVPGGPREHSPFCLVSLPAALTPHSWAPPHFLGPLSHAPPQRGLPGPPPWLQ